MVEGAEMLVRMFQKHLYECVVLFLFLIYTALFLTPSSYGLALSIFGYGGEGLLWGTPRPIRSDEWVVWTPYFQSVVNNDFSAFNQYSMFHEKFREFAALPIADWGLIFKPYFWPFFIAGPARAFSVYHGLIIIAFLLGWKLSGNPTSSLVSITGERQPFRHPQLCVLPLLKSSAPSSILRAVTRSLQLIA